MANAFYEHTTRQIKLIKQKCRTSCVFAASAMLTGVPYREFEEAGEKNDDYFPNIGNNELTSVWKMARIPKSTYLVFNRIFVFPCIAAIDVLFPHVVVLNIDTKGRFVCLDPYTPNKAPLYLGKLHGAMQSMLDTTKGITLKNNGDSIEAVKGPDAKPNTVIGPAWWSSLMMDHRISFIDFTIAMKRDIPTNFMKVVRKGKL